MEARGHKFPRWFIYPHGMLDPWFQKATSRRLKAVRNWLYWKLIEHRVVAKADGLLFTSEEERKNAAKTFRPYKPKIARNVGYGIPEPPDNLHDQKAAFAGLFPELVDRPFLLFLSRIHPKKGLDLLLKAYAEVQKNSTTENTEDTEFPRLVIAGPCSDKAYWDSLQSLAISLGLQPSNVSCPGFPPCLRPSVSPCENPPPLLHWPGMLTGDLKWGTLRAASAFVLPSHQENFGIAVVEALACGTPVLISNKVNIWREIEQSGAGWVEDDTMEGVSSSLRKWVSLKAEKCAGMETASISCFQKYFSVASAAQRLAESLRNPAKD